ncbi:hypothetical protein FRB98_007081, partial [Tulasnella sp. 332]
MSDLIEEISEVFVFEGLIPNAITFLSGIMNALLAIMEWFPRSGRRHGHLTLDENSNLKASWCLIPGDRLITHYLPKTLDGFWHHYRGQHPRAFPALLRCQKRLLKHINALNVYYNVLLLEKPLNSNIQRLQEIFGLGYYSEDSGDHESAMSCEDELIQMLQRFLLASTRMRGNDWYDLNYTGQLALQARTSSQKERLLQWMSYAIFSQLRISQSSLALELTEHDDVLLQNPLVGLVLSSALQLHLWLYPCITDNQVWVTFITYLQMEVIGHTASNSSPPVTEPAVWCKRRHTLEDIAHAFDTQSATTQEALLN